MRLLAFFLPLVAIAAKGQETWTFIQETSVNYSFVTDIFLDTTGSSLICSYEDTLNTLEGGGALLRLSLSGTAVSTRSLGNGDSYFRPSTIFPGTDTHLHILGSYRRTLDNTAGFVHFRCLSNGTVLDSTYYHIGGFNLIALDNATLTNEGNLFLAGSGAVPGLYFTYSTFLQIGQNGDSLNYLETGTSSISNSLVTRDAVVVQNGVLVSIDKGIMNVVNYRILNADLGFVDGWDGQEPHADPDPFVPADSLLSGALTIRPLAGDEYIVGGKITDYYQNRRSAVYRIDDTGAVNKMFTPTTPYPNDYSFLTSTLSGIDDSTFYFASWRNISLTGFPPPYDPSEPDQIAVYKLDNDLNVLCEYILDGFADNAYYVPYRIKTAPDGGFVLIGGRKDMSDPNSKFAAWAQKFAPGDCTVGIRDHASPEPVSAFPNPGHVGFSIVLNGPVVDGALELYDAMGKLLTTTRVGQNRATVDARDLASGLYLYRVLDAHGVLRGTGKWQKD